MSDRYVVRGRWEDRCVFDTEERKNLWHAGTAELLNDLTATHIEMKTKLEAAEKKLERIRELHLDPTSDTYALTEIWEVLEEASE